MKIKIFFLIFIISFAYFFPVNSHALVGPSSPQKDPSLPEIQIQIVTRDSNGMLVGYLEPSIFYLNNIFLIHDYLDNHSDKKTLITKDGKNFEKFEWEEDNYITSSGHQQTAYALGWEGFSVLQSRNDGQISGAGDVVTAFWHIIRTI